MRSIIFTLAMAVALTVSTALPTEDSVFKFRLLHTNDMHARFEQVSQSSGKCSEPEAVGGSCYGGFARVQGALVREMARAQRENVSVLSLNAGDTYQGTVWYAVHKWKVVSHFLKMLKIDAMALGNHEFDDGIKGLTPFLADVGIPVLAANIDASEEPDMANSQVRSSMTLERGGRKIGIIGYLTPDTVFFADVGKLKFKDEIRSLTEEARRLRAMGVDIIVALGHSGYEVDLKIAAQVPDVDVVVGGHSHTFLYTGPPPDSEKPADRYPVMVVQRSGRKVAMVQAYAYTKYLGILDLEFDGEGELVEAKGNPIVLDGRVPEDPDVLREVNEWRNKFNATLKESIGKTKVLLEGSLCRFLECNLGNLITDAYVHHAVKTSSGPYWTRAAIAIQQAGGIRASINASATNGTITREDVITSMPFFGTLSVVRIKGLRLREAFEWSVARYDTSHQWGRGEFLQSSGIRVEFNMFNPFGSRVTSLMVRCQKCQIPRFQPCRDEEDYIVIMPTFIKNGGDNFTMFRDHGEELEKFDEADTDVVIKYLEEKRLVYDGLEDRIKMGLASGSAILKANVSLFIVLFILSKFC